MAIYSHKNAKLGELDGTGYLFRDRSGAGRDQYRGVFFAESEEAEALEALVGGDPVEFTGTLYKRGASRQVSSSKVTTEVTVQTFRKVSAGHRVTFQAFDM
jgi:S-adenosylmethionine:tRNA-ribosyltransferase-isomerase (queuine synthetase)